jgi:hypothetical protein
MAERLASQHGIGTGSHTGLVSDDDGPPAKQCVHRIPFRPSLGLRHSASWNSRTHGVPVPTWQARRKLG